MLRNVRVYVESHGNDGELNVFVAGEAPDGRPAHLRVNEEGRLIRHRHNEGSRMEPVGRAQVQEEPDGPAS